MRENNLAKDLTSLTLSSNQRLRQGAAAAWPICLGYFPVGLALGVLASQAGLPWWAVALMSILVFAGSAQFICVALLASGAATWSIVTTTLVVNLRHALMSSALAIYLKKTNRWFLTFFAYVSGPVRLYTDFLKISGFVFCQFLRAVTGGTCPRFFCGMLLL